MNRDKLKQPRKLKTSGLFVVFCTILFLIVLANLSVPSFAGEEEIHIVNPKSIYSSSPFYLEINENMEQLQVAYGDILELRKIGESVDGNSILALGIGKGKENVLVIGGMHGREAITSVLLLNQIEEILIAYNSSDTYKYGGYQTKKILDDVCIWFVPLINPDGAEISLNGGGNLSNQNLLRATTFGENDLGKWKANLNGVDLNRNYTLHKWGTLDVKGYAFYPGPAPFSEPETKAIVEFTKEKNFVAAINYHAAGEIIYWNPPYHVIAQRMSNITGYPLVPPSKNPPTPTYDTWFFNKTGNPVFTIEIGEGGLKGPMAFEKYNSIWKKNWLIPIVFARELQKVQDVAIFFKGNELELLTPPVREATGQVLVPLRETMEKIGAEVTWEKERKMVCISIDGSITEIPQELPAKTIKGITYLPLKNIIENFDYSLEWDNYTKSAWII